MAKGFENYLKKHRMFEFLVTFLLNLPWNRYSSKLAFPNNVGWDFSVKTSTFEIVT
jgi:hypothetical protein